MWHAAAEVLSLWLCTPAGPVVVVVPVTAEVAASVKLIAFCLLTCTTTGGACVMGSDGAVMSSLNLVTTTSNVH